MEQKGRLADIICDLCIAPSQVAKEFNGLLLFFFAHQHKAAGVKTKQKQRLRRLLIRCSLC